MDKIDQLVDIKRIELHDPKDVDLCLVTRVVDLENPAENSAVIQCFDCGLNVWADNNIINIIQAGKTKAICIQCFFNKDCYNPLKQSVMI